MATVVKRGYSLVQLQSKRSIVEQYFARHGWNYVIIDSAMVGLRMIST